MNISWVVTVNPVMKTELLYHSVTKLPRAVVSIHFFVYFILYSHSTPFHQSSPIHQKSSSLFCSYLTLLSPEFIFLESLFPTHVCESTLSWFSFTLLAVPSQYPLFTSPSHFSY